MTRINEWLFRRGTLAADGWDSVVDGSAPGWRHTGIRVGQLPATGALHLDAGPVERMIVPLSGDVDLAWDGPGDAGRITLEGRQSVFEGPADVAYLGAGTSAMLRGGGRVAVTEAAADRELPFTVLRKREVPVELRGAGTSSRQVHNFGVPGALEAQRLIACEVITPSGNWSSYPAHKHDETVDGVESRLEEIYYFEAAVERGAPPMPDADPFGMFSTYSSPAGQIDTAALVRTGDIALVPFGYHGPAAAAPGYDLYYLNVMAGPDPERAWRITDDPAHAWVRQLWERQAPDERLPYGPREGSIR
ncbi:MAG: 5-deoxy-glucuronate isomerase [Actinomycetota bacterium]|nr:5-deoxy-glucuronate isomerase [Actinomycetota bacterium]